MFFLQRNNTPVQPFTGHSLAASMSISFSLCMIFHPNSSETAKVELSFGLWHNHTGELAGSTDHIWPQIVIKMQLLANKINTNLYLNYQKHPSIYWRDGRAWGRMNDWMLLISCNWKLLTNGCHWCWLITITAKSHESGGAFKIHRE